MSKKSGFHRQIWPKSVTHLHGITLYNVEGLDHKVHEPVTVPEMADMQSQYN